MAKENWLYVTVRCSPEVAPALHEHLLALGGNRGTVETPAGREVLVGTYIPDDERASKALQSIVETTRQLRRLFPEALLAGPATELIPAQDWRTLWRRHHKLLTVGRVVIKPTWLPTPSVSGDSVVVELEPQMAFGTGAHSSTQLALLALQEYLKSGDVIADVGTGTGVLAIAAVLLGAARVYATDADPIAARAARTNARLNGVAQAVDVLVGEYLAGVPAPLDGVIANLSPRADEELVPLAAAHLKSEGFLILSGFTNRTDASLRGVLEGHGFRVHKRYVEAEWVCLAGKREVSARTGNT